MRRQAARRSRIMAEINITPFTDVVLVLLIIFMITTPLLLQPGIKVQLPKAASAESDTQKNITLMVDPQGAVFLNNRRIEPGSLEQELSLRLMNDPDMPVIVKADKEVKYDYVVTVIDAAKKAGAKRFALAVELKQ